MATPVTGTLFWRLGVLGVRQIFDLPGAVRLDWFTPRTPRRQEEESIKFLGGDPFHAIVISDMMPQLFRSHRSGEMIALHKPAAKTPQNFDLSGCFNAFDNAFKLQRTTQRDDRRDDLRTIAAAFDINHKTAINLDLVDWQLVNIAQA